MTDAAAFRADAKEVALPIYVDLVARTVSFAEGGVKISVSPENLAKLSYKLAHAFLAVHDELNAANLPKDPTYKLASDDIASWTTK
jgi:hypothetical protein